MGKRRVFAYIFILVVALILRLLCLPSTPFFGDLPCSIKAIEEGTMRIQFPGYVPYHLSVQGLSLITGSLFLGAVLYTILCGLLSIFYIVKTVEKISDFEEAAYAGIIMGWGTLGVYFSIIGASYCVDMLAVAGFLYHGISKIYEPTSRNHVLLAVLWCCLGIFMRPLSGMWILPAAVFLNWKWGNKREIAYSCLILVVAMMTFLIICSPFYNSILDIVSTMGAPIGLASQFDWITWQTNFFRLLCYPLYFLNIWLLLGFWCGWIWWKHFMWQKEESKETEILWLLVVLFVPYFIVLIRYVAQPGYYCLLLPIFCILPIVFNKFLKQGKLLMRVACASFILISAVQTFVLHPIPSTSLTRIVANAYFLQYSREGIKTSTFETVSSLAYKTGIEKDKIPESRLRNILYGGGK